MRILQNKRVAVEHCADIYEFLVGVRMGADHIASLVTGLDEAWAKHTEVSAALELSRIRVIVAAAPLIDAEGGGNIGIACASTERIREQLNLASKRIELSEQALKDARIAYDKSQAARASATKRSR